MFKVSWEYDTAERIANDDMPENVDVESDREDIARWAELKLKGESDPGLRWVDTAFKAWKTGVTIGDVFNDEELDEMDERSEAEMERQRMSEEYRIEEKPEPMGLMGMIVKAMQDISEVREEYDSRPMYRRVYTLAVTSEKMMVIFNTYKEVRDMNNCDDPDFKRDWDAAMADIRCGVNKATRCLTKAREKLMEDTSYETEDWFRERMEKGDGEDE